MLDFGKKSVLGVYVNAIDYEATTNQILRAIKQNESCAVTALAVHGVMTGVLDPEHRYRLNHIDLVAPDGQPVRWTLRLLHGSRLPDRVYGPELMLRLCQRAAVENVPIFLYGSTEENLESLRDRLTKRFSKLRICGTESSKFRPISVMEKEALVARIRSSGAGMVFVGLGCPRQEIWIYEYRRYLRMPIIAVGAAFDFHAGTLKQAPPLLQRLGLEWLYRLLHEPRRLWRRYVLLNPLYILYVMRQWLRLGRFDDRGTPPRRELLPG